MYFRTFILALISVSIVAACSSGKLGAPSSGEVSEPEPFAQPEAVDNDAGVVTTVLLEDSGAPTPVVDSGPKLPTNQAECVAACEAKYPTPAALNKQLDETCFLGGSCEPVCNNLAPNGPLFGVTVGDAGDLCPIGDGIDPIMTHAKECSNCIAETASCCKLWVDIFGSDDGRNLNKCAVKCFSDFKN